MGNTCRTLLRHRPNTLATIETYTHFHFLNELPPNLSLSLTLACLKCVRSSSSLVWVLMSRQSGSPQTYTFTLEFIVELLLYRLTLTLTLVSFSQTPEPLRNTATRVVQQKISVDHPPGGLLTFGENPVICTVKCRFR